MSFPAKWHILSLFLMPVVQCIVGISPLKVLLHMCLISFKYDAKSKAWDILLEITSVTGNLCNKCPSSYSNKTAVKVILSMQSLVSIKQQSPRRPWDILVANVGQRLPKLPKLPKLPTVSENVQSSKCSKQHFQGLANKVLERSVSKCSVCARGLCHPVQACSGPETLPSLV